MAKCKTKRGYALGGQVEDELPKTSWDRTDTSFDRGDTSFDRGDTSFDRADTSFNRNNTSFGLSKDAPTGGSSGGKPALNYEPMRYAQGSPRPLTPEQMLGFADGGQVSKAEQLIAEMNKKYGLGGTAQPQPIAQLPAPQPAAAPPPQQPRGLVGDALNLLGNRQKQIDKAAGYACGGKIKAHAQGGLIEGPGTPTSDSISARIKDTGENILVSNGERILSKDQDVLLGNIARMLGFESVDQLLESGTGKPVGPTIKGGKRAARWGANGEWINDEIPKETNLSPLAWQTQTVAPFVANQGRGVMQTPLEKSIEKSFSAFRSGVPQGTEVPAKNPLTNSLAAASPESGVSINANYGNEGRSVPRPITKTSPGLVVDNEFTAGVKDYTVNPTSQAGITRVTATGTSPLYTNINPETAVNRLAGMKSGQMRIDGGFDLAGQNERMAKSLGYAGTDDFNRQWRLRNDPVQQQAEFAANGQPQPVHQRQNTELDSQLKRLQLKQQGIVSDLQDKALAGDKNALASLKSIGAIKTSDPEYMAHVVGGGVDPQTGMPLPQRLAITEKRTGASRFMDEKPAAGVTNMEEISKARAAGMKDSEIVARIKAAGGNPKDYGLQG